MVNVIEKSMKKQNPQFFFINWEILKEYLAYFLRQYQEKDGKTYSFAKTGLDDPWG